MSRRIITRQFQSFNSDQKVDTYSDRLLKNIPADIVAAWVSVSNLIGSASDIPKDVLLWIALFIGIILTALWTKKQTHVEDLPVAKKQIIISAGSFIVWVFALGVPFSQLSFYRPLYGSLLLILYTLIIPLIPTDDVA